MNAREDLAEMSHSILVPVPNAVDNVFVVMPFDNSFQPLFHAIHAAALKAGLTAHTTDTKLSDQDFLRDVVKSTREDKIIVAVVTPDPRSDCANPNVMYELGRAHAIGKATILLTTDPNQLPADLKTKTAMTYDPARLDENFIFRLYDKMMQVKERIKNGITDSAEREIRVVDGFPTSWRELMKVLNFGKQFHRSFQELDTGHLDALVRDGDEIVNNSVDPARLSRLKANFQNNWNRYLDQYKTAISNVQSHEFRDEVINDAFDCISKSAADRALINKCVEFASEIRNQLEVYTRFHGDAKSLTQNSVVTVFDKPIASEFLKMLIQLAGDAKRLVMLSDGLILNMINLITEVGETK